MVSMTDTDTTISFATPDDVRQASEKAFHIWLGALSPLWAPFMAATATGLSFWSMSQVMKRSLGFASVEALTPDAHLFAKWPGFAVPFATPWSRGWGEVAEDADRIAELTHDSLSAPIQIAFEAEEKLEAAIDEAIASAHHSLDLLTPKADDLFSAAAKAPEAAVGATEKTAGIAEKAGDAVIDVTETAAKVSADTTAKAAGAAAKSAGAVIDPVTEAPVVPAVAEATAEKVPLPLAEVSPAAAPRKPRKPKA